jgi:hypothetical protein
VTYHLHSSLYCLCLCYSQVLCLKLRSAAHVGQSLPEPEQELDYCSVINRCVGSDVPWLSRPCLHGGATGVSWWRLFVKRAGLSTTASTGAELLLSH